MRNLFYNETTYEHISLKLTYKPLPPSVPHYDKKALRLSDYKARNNYPKSHKSNPNAKLNGLLSKLKPGECLEVRPFDAFPFVWGKAIVYRDTCRRKGIPMRLVRMDIYKPDENLGRIWRLE